MLVLSRPRNDSSAAPAAWKLIGGNLISLADPKILRGDLDLSDRFDLMSLGEVEIIYGHVHFTSCENLLDLGALAQVYGMLDLSGCFRLMSLGNLRYVKESLNLARTGISELPVELTVGWNFIGSDGYPVRPSERRHYPPAALASNGK